MATTWDRYTLITNLDYVTVETVRTMTHALLVQRGEGLFSREKPQHMLRGFSTSASLPTFDTIVPTDEFELVPAQSSAIFIGEDNEPRPLFGGAIMKIAGTPIEVQLIAANGSRDPIDVQRFPEGTDINAVWETLERKVAQHWHAPNMPLPQWVPAQSVRRRHGVRL